MRYIYYFMRAYPMLVGIIFILTIIGLVYCFAIHPYQKIKKIKNNIVLQVDGADIRYSNLLLGNLGIFYEINQERKVHVIFPKLTSEGYVKYIYSWHSLQSISVPVLGKLKIQDKNNLRRAQELAILISEHVRFIEPEILNLRNQWHKINELLNLISTSDLYSSQQEIYERALVQVENLLAKAQEIELVYIRYIKELLITSKVIGFDPNLIPNNGLAIDDKYKKIREEYQLMKDTATAYAELIQKHQV